MLNGGNLFILLYTLLHNKSSNKNERAQGSGRNLVSILFSFNVLEWVLVICNKDVSLKRCALLIMRVRSIVKNEVHNLGRKKNLGNSRG